MEKIKIMPRLKLLIMVHFYIIHKKVLRSVLLLVVIYSVLYLLIAILGDFNITLGDFKITYAINQWATTLPSEFVDFAWFYTQYIYYILGGILYLLIVASFYIEKLKPYRIFLLGYALGFVAALGINSIIKVVFNRLRPFQEYPGQFVTFDRPLPIDSSFPSGHSAAGFGMAAPPMRRFKKVLVWIAFSFYAVTLALTRPFFGVHFATDILTGSAVGIVSSIGFTTWFQSLEKKGVLTERFLKQFLMVLTVILGIIIILAVAINLIN